MDATEVIPPGNRPRWGCVASAVLVLGFGVFILLHPTTNCGPTKGGAQRLQAQTAMKGLYIALAGFQAEYEVSLTGRLGFKENEDHLADEVLLRPLIDAKSELNPRKTRFYDPPEGKKGKNGLWRAPADGQQMQLRDPWGGPYRIRSDSDGDGKIVNPEDPAGERIFSSVILYSAGPDQDFDTWKDNVTSWK
ncbi:hypothetical protein [Verrucomicrobium sp. BvORR034]|uniref:hypothetical protein n=1 Tax=Verrucomicrobium sp. BvORR034 TaxID=1396418 RepID=UPI0006797716|nr:hypothetical protein [Verrucomicrobium sp. BvORR034]